MAKHSTPGTPAHLTRAPAPAARQTTRQAAAERQSRPRQRARNRAPNQQPIRTVNWVICEERTPAWDALWQDWLLAPAADSAPTDSPTRWHARASAPLPAHDPPPDTAMPPEGESGGITTDPDKTADHSTTEQGGDFV